MADEDGGHRARRLSKRLGAGLLVLVASLTLLASFSVKTALEVYDYMGLDPVADSPWAFRALEVVAALVLATLLFAALFWLLPDAKLSFRLVWHAAFWTAKVYTLVQIVAAFALVYLGGVSVFGLAAVPPVLIGYFYFAAMSFLWGAEILRLDVERHGAEPRPAPWARRR